MKKIIFILVMVVALNACISPYPQKDDTTLKDRESVSIGTSRVEHVTATVIRVGRYLCRDADATESGTVLIFDNGQVFKRTDKGSGTFACAVKEGDTLTYDRTPDGKITLTGFVVK